MRAAHIARSAPLACPVTAPERPDAQDWGARDPTAGELASNFSEKVLGNWDTEHLIR